MKLSFVNMIQDVAERNGNINVEIVTDALKAATNRITSPKYMTAGMGDAGSCHPRDNIALQWLSNKLNLGYDLFHSIMYSRDIQAKNLSDRLIELSLDYDLPIVIHGKSYKPYVPYCDGSYSLLVGYYIEKRGFKVNYADPLTDDSWSGPAVILMAHNPTITYSGTGVNTCGVKYYFDIEKGSVILDPWRTTGNIPDVKVLHYGNRKYEINNETNSDYKKRN
jgi:UDPglucose 6-dehydrogenase